MLLSGPGSASLALHQGYCLHNGCCRIQNVSTFSNGCKFRFQSSIHTHFHQDLIFLPDVNILDSFTYEAQSLIPTYQRLKRSPLTTCSVPVSMLNGAWLDSKAAIMELGARSVVLEGDSITLVYWIDVARQAQHPFLRNINRVGATLL